jgi:hypothetical protein
MRGKWATGSKAAGLTMAFKLLEAAQDCWRAVNGPDLVALVGAGARFDKGVMVERPDKTQEAAPQPVARRVRRTTRASWGEPASRDSDGTLVRVRRWP